MCSSVTHPNARLGRNASGSHESRRSDVDCLSPYSHIDADSHPYAAPVRHFDKHARTYGYRNTHCEASNGYAHQHAHHSTSGRP
ncbi:MAG: hypothetical protein ACUVXG_02730 [Anaerolineae bacterium]